MREAAAAGLDAFGFDGDYAQPSVLAFIRATGMDLALYNLTTPDKIKMAVANGQKYVGTDNPVAIRNLLAGFDSDGASTSLESLDVKPPSLKSKTVYDKSMSKGKQSHTHVINKSSMVPAKAQ